MTAPVDDLPFTEFIQHPTASTGRLANVRALRLRRRDADDLMVMQAARADRETEVVELVGRILASLVRHREGRDLIRRLLPESLPWVRFLPPPDQQILITELVDVVEAGAAIDNVAPIAQLLTEWRHTAEVHADPELYAILSTPRGEDYGAMSAISVEDRTGRSTDDPPRR